MKKRNRHSRLLLVCCGQYFNVKTLGKEGGPRQCGNEHANFEKERREN